MALQRPWRNTLGPSVRTLCWPFSGPFIVESSTVATAAFTNSSHLYLRSRGVEDGMSEGDNDDDDDDDG